MLGLPPTTEVKRPLPKAQLFKRFDWTPSQRDRFDGEVSRLDFVNWISPRTVPAIAVDNEVKEIFFVEVSLKSRDFDTKAITLLAKSIPQKIVYVLRYENEVIVGVYHTKMLFTPWTRRIASLQITGLNLDSVWENIVCHISGINSSLLTSNSSVSDILRQNDERAKLERQIAALERQMNATRQPRRKRELFAELQKLKGGLNG